MRIAVGSDERTELTDAVAAGLAPPGMHSEGREPVTPVAAARNTGGGL